MNRSTMAVLSVACALTACGSSGDHNTERMAQTTEGPVEGLTTNGVTTFKGIPYAAAPVGALRWQAPQSPAQHKATLAAHEFGAACVQSLDSGVPSDLGAALADLGTAFPPPKAVSEDCLFVNVFKPATASAQSKLPVLVYVHGGAFTQGSGNVDLSNYAAQGIIAVSINYRLGALGYLADSEIAKNDTQGAYGNFGLRDQIAALSWVKKNIAAFGGNPDKLTYWGTSAGATSGFSVLQAPSAKGLLSSIFLQSGGGGAYSNPTTAQSLEVGIALTQKLGCADASDRAACLRAKTAEQVMQAQGTARWRPTVDGVVLTDTPANAFESGQFNRVPVLLGGVHDEGTLFSSSALPAEYYEAAVAGIVAPAKADAAAVLRDYPLSDYPSAGMAFARIQGDAMYSCGNAARGDALAQWVPVYGYEFTDPAKSFPLNPTPFYLGSFHGLDSLYWSGTRTSAKADASTLAMQRSMQNYLLNFIHTGNPNDASGKLPAWPRHSAAAPATLALTVPNISVQTNFKSAHRCDTTWSPGRLQPGIY